MQVDQLHEKVFTISDVFTPEECEHYIDFTEKVGYAPAPVTTPWGPEMMPNVRNNERVMFDDNNLAASLWQKLQPLLPTRLQGKKAVGLNERFRFYKYRPGQEFKEHKDGHFRRNAQEVSLLTLLIYLNEDFTGGDTFFRKMDINFVPKQGTALIFEHRVIHAGLPVIEGVKYVLRSDVMYQ
ncbi:2OG-Fe(II) oxygenase [uncultured Microscilla sp.]|uniref:2OG-Fe(II) oxygenase n=1 Tax=uncultured Microscilla sp. TaxID=432653 RepID=UPI0026334513|nr:2OG-Fe(II) oxygenase [uncultured Microscilla sp.]